MLFVLYLFAGRYKADPRFQWLPLDLTALTFGLSVVVGTNALLRRRTIAIGSAAVWMLMLFGLFVAYSTLALTWSPSNQYGPAKVLYLATLVAWCVVAAAVVIAPERTRVRRLLSALVVFALWVGIETLLAYLKGGGAGFVVAMGGNYLGLGRVIGVGVAGLLIYCVYLASGLAMRTAAAALCAGLAALLLVIGGRGPFLAAAASMLLLLVVPWRWSAARGLVVRRYGLWLAGCLAAGGIAAAMVMSRSGVGVTVARLERLLSAQMGASAGVRLAYWREAIAHWADAPFLGHGPGSWPVVFSAVDERGYPHDIVLEVLFELGLVGLTLLLAQVLVGVRSVARGGWLREDPLRLFAVLLFANAALNALVSGDITDNRVVFVALGLLTVPAFSSHPSRARRSPESTPGHVG
jgi:O-antigen ligase